MVCDAHYTRTPNILWIGYERKIVWVVWPNLFFFISCILVEKIRENETLNKELSTSICFERITEVIYLFIVINSEDGLRHEFDQNKFIRFLTKKKKWSPPTTMRRCKAATKKKNQQKKTCSYRFGILDCTRFNATTTARRRIKHLSNYHRCCLWIKTKMEN